MESYLIDNYREYKKQEFRFGDITFLVGNNGLGKSNIIDLIEFVKSFNLINNINKNFLKNSEKKFTITHLWKGNSRNRHYRDIKVPFEFIEFSFAKKTKRSFISRYATFRGADVVLFSFENRMKYKVLENFSLEENVQSVYKIIKSQFLAHKNDMRIIIDHSFYSYENIKRDYSIEQIFSLFASTTELRSTKKGKALYEQLINGSKIQEYVKKQKTAENFEQHDDELFIIFKLLEEMSTNLGIRRLYKKNNLQTIEGIRPTKISDFIINDWLSSKYAVLENEKNLTRINQYLKKSSFPWEISINNYKKNNNKYKHLYLQSNGKSFDINEGGDGIKQIIPILMSLLENKNILSIKEPEVHLHPISICELGTFIFKNFNNQIIMETHSKLLVDRIRWENFQAKTKKEIFINNLVFKNNQKKNFISQIRGDGRFEGDSEEYLKYHEDEILKWF